MHIDDFNIFVNILRERSGLVVTADKSYLLESRLTPVARKWHLKNLEDLSFKIRNKDEPIIADVVEAMTTNESTFFRDSKPFDQFRDVLLPHFLAERATQKRLRIWCAACSSGQEPYSLAMILNEASAKLAGWKIEIHATDLSGEMVEKAKAGVYSQFEVQRGLPITYLMKYFDQVDSRWEIKPQLKQMVDFQTFNLLDNYTSKGQFDIVYCRNVLIYFEQDLKRIILDKMAGVLQQDGVLYLGGAETVLGVSDKFKPRDGYRGMYVKEGSTIALKAAS